jgi:hypothetical protein
MRGRAATAAGALLLVSALAGVLLHHKQEVSLMYILNRFRGTSPSLFFVDVSSRASSNLRSFTSFIKAPKLSLAHRKRKIDFTLYDVPRRRSSRRLCTRVEVMLPVDSTIWGSPISMMLETTLSTVATRGKSNTPTCQAWTRSQVRERLWACFCFVCLVCVRFVCVRARACLLTLCAFWCAYCMCLLYVLSVLSVCA